MDFTILFPIAYVYPYVIELPLKEYIFIHQSSFYLKKILNITKSDSKNNFSSPKLITIWNNWLTINKLKCFEIKNYWKKNIFFVVQLKKFIFGKKKFLDF